MARKQLFDPGTVYLGIREDSIGYMRFVLGSVAGSDKEHVRLDAYRDITNQPYNFLLKKAVVVDQETPRLLALVAAARSPTDRRLFHSRTQAIALAIMHDAVRDDQDYLFPIHYVPGKSQGRSVQFTKNDGFTSFLKDSYHREYDGTALTSRVYLSKDTLPFVMPPR